MRKALFTMMCLAAMLAAGTGLRAQEATIVIAPGYTWISNPSTDTLDFATALGGFVPVQGDVIQSQWGNAQYRNGRWQGAISQFYPGYGYKYKSNRSTPMIVTLGEPLPYESVSTAEPSGVGATSAVVGGTVSIGEGNHVFARGVCWGTAPSPDIDGSHSSEESGVGVFSTTLEGLTPSTDYYVRAYAVTDNGLAYGEELSFITLDGGSNGHEYVDLGLPSGLLWATCNVGADSPEDYGDYFAWGETQPKDIYNWSTYQYCMGSNSTLTKYCNNSSYGYNGFTDDLTTLLPEDDAATANWGADWRMPTKEEWQELLDNTTRIWTTQNGVDGRLFTASNGNSLFLPAAGYRYYSSLYDAGSKGDYWSSSLTTDSPSVALDFLFGSGGYSVNGSYRSDGLSVRAVRSSTQNTTPTGAINGKFTINANGDQVYFSQGNLQYIGSAATPYWKFADNQWDVLGTNTGQNSSDQNVDRDLFGWGTSGWNNGNTYYRPWDTSNSSGSSYGPPGQYDLTGSYANADWGVYNPISNGGNQANQWRTLTHPEWAYIFNTRTTSSGIRYAKANVNNVNGVILLPDDWSSDSYSLSNTNSSGASYSSNTITASQWNTLEQAGAVFLPTAGVRSGTSVHLLGSEGDYWSASYINSHDAWFMNFNNSNLNTDNNLLQFYGLSVRLVAPAEN